MTDSASSGTLSAVLAAVFVAALLAAAGSTLLLFVPPRSGRPAHRLVAGLAAAAALAPGLVLLGWLGTPARALAPAAAILAAADLAWLRLTRRWNARGHAAWTAATTAGISYLLYMLRWTFRTHLGGVGTAGGLLLWLLEACAVALGIVYGWEVVDVLARRDWRRRRLEGSADSERPATPFVSLHVPAHNEPPDMVIGTLTSLLALDYPAFEIVMVDDNTDDEELWRPVEAFCAERGITFHHLEDWPGYKSGALNFALTVTDPRAEVIGVVDADYLVSPDYLTRCAPLFSDETLAFVQTPQDYRDWEQSPYYRRLYYSYRYFFDVSQVSRNERDSAIFGGTMGLIRRTALEQVGRWDEWCITEDAELSLRLLRAGWTGQHVERSYGSGIMPLTFEALKRQRFRWCFGGVQILRKHWKSLLPWDRDPDNHLSLRQRYDYLAGGLQWFGDLLSLVFAALIAFGVLNLATGSGFTFRRLSGALLAIPPALIALGTLRTIALVRARTGARWRDAAGALGMWLALSLTVARACARGLVRGEGVFLRTPKTKGETTWREALSANRLEVVTGTVLLALVPLAAISATPVTAGLLAALVAWQAGGFLLAPVNSLAAMRADLPPELRRLRRMERLRERMTRPVPAISVGIGATVLAGVGAAAFLLLAPATKVNGALPDVINEAQGKARPAAGPTATTVPGTSAIVASTRSSGSTSSTTGAGGRAGTPTTAARIGSSPTTAIGPAGGSATTVVTPTATTTIGGTTTTTRPGVTPTTVTSGPSSTTHPTPTTNSPPTTSTPTTRPHP